MAVLALGQQSPYLQPGPGVKEGLAGSLIFSTHFAGGETEALGAGIASLRVGARGNMLHGATTGTIRPTSVCLGAVAQAREGPASQRACVPCDRPLVTRSRLSRQGVNEGICSG